MKTVTGGIDCQADAIRAQFLLDLDNITVSQTAVVVQICDQFFDDDGKFRGILLAEGGPVGEFLSAGDGIADRRRPRHGAMLTHPI